MVRDRLIGPFEYRSENVFIKDGMRAWYAGSVVRVKEGAGERSGLKGEIILDANLLFVV